MLCPQHISRQPQRCCDRSNPHTVDRQASGAQGEAQHEVLSSPQQHAHSGSSAGDADEEIEDNIYVNTGGAPRSRDDFKNQDEHFSDASGGSGSSSGATQDPVPSAQSFGRKAQPKRGQQQPARSSRRIQKPEPDIGRNFVVQPNAQLGARTSRRLTGLPPEMSGPAKSSRRSWDGFTQTFVPYNHQWLGQESPGISQHCRLECEGWQSSPQHQRMLTRIRKGYILSFF